MSGDETELLDMRPVRPGLEGPQALARKDRTRLREASWAFTTRRVPTGAGCSILPHTDTPRIGDLVLARVDAIGHHANLQLVHGRHRHLFPGDEIVVVYGNRYASSQFEALVPDTPGPCHLVAGGGIAARAISWHSRVSKGPTHISPIGLLGDVNDQPLNLAGFSIQSAPATVGYEPTTITVVGTAMDSGKTQTCVHLVRGLADAGLRVGYAKVTGTGAGGDVWWLKDAGADPVLDFTDLGMPSTYLESPETVERVLSTLVSHIAGQGVDAVVIEVADGVLQRETAALLKSSTFARTVGGIILAAQDAMGASAGASSLAQQSVPVLALSGLISSSPLQAAEAAEATGLRVFDREDLASAPTALELIGLAQQHLAAVGGRFGVA